MEADTELLLRLAVTADPSNEDERRRRLARRLLLLVWLTTVCVAVGTLAAFSIPVLSTDPDLAFGAAAYAAGVGAVVGGLASIVMVQLRPDVSGPVDDRRLLQLFRDQLVRYPRSITELPSVLWGRKSRQLYATAGVSTRLLIAHRIVVVGIVLLLVTFFLMI